MATTKVTITLPEELAAHIKAEVAAGRAESVSAWLTAAADAKRHFDPLDLLIASMIAETGEPDEGARAWAERVIEVGKRAQERLHGGTSEPAA